MTNEEFIKSVSLEGEEWRDVVGYEQLYSVSSFGRLMSKTKVLPNAKSFRTTQPILISGVISRNGYRKAILCKSRNERSYVSIHRLVAQAFIPNPNNYPTVDHIDRNRSNNRVENLRWCTLKDNMNNPLTIKHCSKVRRSRTNNVICKPVVAVRNGIVVKQYDSVKSASKDGYKESSIRYVCCGFSKSYKGYKWMYLSDYEKSLVNQ